MTPTAIELINSKEFWLKRVDEQLQYTILYSTSTHTRPDYLTVLNSADMIQERCEKNYLALKAKENNDPF